MTREETRKLGIEFERRLIEVYPQFATEEKLSTDAIYSFLSEFQTQYVKVLYSNEDDFQRGTRRAKRISDVSRSLIRRVNIKTSNDDGLYKLPEDYAMYVRSESIVTKNYKSDKTLGNGERSGLQEGGRQRGDQVLPHGGRPVQVGKLRRHRGRLPHRNRGAGHAGRSAFLIKAER